MASPRNRRQVGPQSQVGAQSQTNNLNQSGGLLGIQQLLGVLLGQIGLQLQAVLPANLAIGNSAPSMAIAAPNGFSGNSASAIWGLLSGLSGGRSNTPAALKCDAIDPKTFDVLSEANTAFKYPIRTRQFDNNITQTTYGYVIDGNTIIHSILEGNSTTMKDFVNEHKDRVTKKTKKTQSRAAGDDENEEDDTEEELQDDALAEYGLRSLTTLAKNMLKSTAESEKVTLSLDCQVESFECSLEARESPDDVQKCSEKLCECLSKIFV